MPMEHKPAKVQWNMVRRHRTLRPFYRLFFSAKHGFFEFH